MVPMRWKIVDAEFWMNLQQTYELRLAEQEAGREIAARVRPRAA